LKGWPLSNAQLQALLRGGEGLNVEFKLKIPQLMRVAKTFSAFSNSSGGVLIFGVDDTGEVVGLENPEGTLTLVQQAALFYCQPAPTYDHQFLQFRPGQAVLIVRVEESDCKPLMVTHPQTGKGSPCPYFRSKSENLPMDQRSRRAMKKTPSENLEDHFEELDRHQQQIIRLLHRQPRCTVAQLAQKANLSVHRTKKMLTQMEGQGWVHAFMNGNRREFSLAVSLASFP
jgi:predicted HTH transcriptional regulator